MGQTDSVSVNRPGGGWAYREQLGPDAAGKTVVSHLASTYAHSSSEEWSQRLARGEVELDGEVARGSAVLRTGQILIWHRPAWDEPPVPLHYDVLYEDAAIIAVAKPAGLPTMPAGGFLHHTLLTLLRHRYADARPVHRLGRHTSGVVLFARTREAAASLGAAWRQREVTKEYVALANGVATSERFEVTVPIGPVPHRVLGSVHAVSPTGKWAHTVAVVLERRADSTLFRVEITTGRPHQIRIHLAYAGHPLQGDRLYAVGGLPIAEGAALPGDGDYHLHAERLLLLHPVSKTPLEITAPTPAELRRCSFPAAG